MQTRSSPKAQAVRTRGDLRGDWLLPRYQEEMGRSNARSVCAVPRWTLGGGTCPGLADQGDKRSLERLSWWQVTECVSERVRLERTLKNDLDSPGRKLTIQGTGRRKPEFCIQQCHSYDLGLKSLSLKKKKKHMWQEKQSRVPVSNLSALDSQSDAVHSDGSRPWESGDRYFFVFEVTSVNSSPLRSSTPKTVKVRKSGISPAALGSCPGCPVHTPGVL